MPKKKGWKGEWDCDFSKDAKISCEELMSAIDERVRWHKPNLAINDPETHNKVRLNFARRYHQDDGENLTSIMLGGLTYVYLQEGETDKVQALRDLVKNMTQKGRATYKEWNDYEFVQEFNLNKKSAFMRGKNLLIETFESEFYSELRQVEQEPSASDGGSSSFRDIKNRLK